MAIPSMNWSPKSYRIKEISTSMKRTAFFLQIKATKLYPQCEAGHLKVLKITYFLSKLLIQLWANWICSLHISVNIWPIDTGTFRLPYNNMKQPTLSSLDLLHPYTPRSISWVTLGLLILKINQIILEQW